MPDARDDFIREAVRADLGSGRVREVVTRFPPEPNGHLHIGHAKAICTDFGIAAEFGGRCHLRMDDTNPEKEEAAYAEGIRRDVRWLGFDWGAREYHASDYFDRIYAAAERLIERGLAYVDDQTADRIRATRGTLTEPGRPSPRRDRPPAENLDLFRRMRAGAFPDGAMVLRAKIDMSSPNLNMRDPVLYRILRAPHPRTLHRWCIYPMYDFAHPLSDAIEGVTHSICTLEFEDHRPLYDWVIEHAWEGPPPRPRQYEFARLELTHTVMSKRRLLRLVEEGIVEGWDDPRLPTLAGLRRRGYTPEAIRDFCARVGLAKTNAVTEQALLEACLREDLNRRAPRAMGVLDPVRLVLENWPAGRTEEVEIENNPEDPSAGRRKVPFDGTLWIERDDFRAEALPKFHRLAPGREVRLKGAYLVRCTGFEADAEGRVTEVRARADLSTRGGEAPDGRKVKGTIHWVSAAHAVEAEVRLYEPLFRTADPDEGGDWLKNLNPDSRRIVRGAKVEPALALAPPGSFWQFLRHGYFSRDPDAPALLFHRSVALKDSYANSGTRTPR